MQFTYTRTLLSSFMLLAGGFAFAESPYRMEGVVTDADTQQPVANTTVQVLITSEPDPSQKTRKAVTGEDGRYSIELPAGHGWAWTLLPPDGYRSVESNSTEVFATTTDRPIFTKNYQVRQGSPVQFLVRYPDTLDALPKTFVFLGQQKDNEYIHGFCELDQNATGTVTLLNLAGEFIVSCEDEKRTLVVPNGMTVDFEQGFNPRNVLSKVKSQDDGTIVVQDSNGRNAKLTNCVAVVNDHQLTIVVDVNAVGSEDESTRLQGRVVDTNGKGIEGAKVTAAFYSNGGSASSQIQVTTGGEGQYTVSIPKLRGGQKVGLIVTRKGFSGLDTKPIDIAPDSKGIVTIDPVTLKAGCSIRVRVVGVDGKPLHGAVVEPLNDYASGTRIARTGPNGECVLTGLAAGLMRVSAQFGNQSTSTKIPLDSGENELVVLKLKPRVTAPPTETPKRLPALAAGTAAPQWSIAEWTDGRQRKLTDYHGKVVVLDFWGVWCTPCIHAIPAMKELHDRYKEDDVVFLGIHTAGTDMSLVKRLLKQ
ncbi:redoxin domain-containing protein [Planctomycetota bacterium]